VKELDSKLDASIRSILYPLASILLREGIGVRPVIQILKEAFVRAAVDEHGNNGKPASTSKAAGLVGLTRKEVGDIRERPVKLDEILDSYARTEGAVLSLWNSDPNYQDRQGAPKRLRVGPGPGTFAEVAAKALGGDRYELALERLENIGCVQRHDDGTVEFLRLDTDVSQNVPHILAYALGTLSATVDKNTRPGTGTSLCQRTVSVAGVSAEYVPLLRRKLRARIERFTEEVDDLIVDPEYLSDDAEAADGPVRLGIGVHYFEVNRTGIDD
jgi:hypothetical protein